MLVLSEYSGFLPQAEDMQLVGLNGDSKLPISGNGCLLALQ